MQTEHIVAQLPFSEREFSRPFRLLESDAEDPAPVATKSEAEDANRDDGEEPAAARLVG